MLPSLESWYLVCAASELRPGQVRAVDDLEPALLVYRTRSGQLRASARFCPHLGTDLTKGSVDGDGLTCPMHAWKFDGSGACVEAPGYAQPKRRLAQYPVLERYGAIFVATSPEVRFEPAFVDLPESQAVSRLGAPFDVGCAWHVAAANSYDIRHFATIHRRSFHSEPELSLASPSQLQIRIHAGATGDGLRERVIRSWGKNSVQIRITNHGGTLLTVESRVRSMALHVLVSLYPLASGTRVRTLFAIPRSGPLDALKLRWSMGRSLSFIAQDLAVLDGARLDPEHVVPEDEHLRRFYAWLPRRAAPALPPGAA
ncbi:MAG: Rieske (2Fe-2S) protein [Myxococcaceae bacterium]|nr:Rieske (2Fe-2S) protein [Myxococcaceae bacterium]